MNYNILAYCIYIIATILLIYGLGKYFHKNGRIFIFYLFHQQTNITDSTNNILLILYYLLNMGYAVVQLYLWQRITSLSLLLSSLIEKLSFILIILACIHYLNMLIIYIYSKKNNKYQSFTS